MFLGLGLRAVQGINLSKWERQRFALCEVCCDTEQDGVRSFPFSTGVCLRNPQPSLARLKAALMNLIEDWSDCLHFASDCFGDGLMNCLQLSGPMWIILFRVTFIIKRWKQKAWAPSPGSPDIPKGCCCFVGFFVLLWICFCLDYFDFEVFSAVVVQHVSILDVLL